MDWVSCCKTFLCTVKELHRPAPELSAFQQETEFLPVPAASLSRCIYRSLPDCTVSTKEREEAGYLTGICLVYKASLAVPIPMASVARLSQHCSAAKPRGEWSQREGEVGVSVKVLALNGDTAAPMSSCFCAGNSLRSQGCSFAGPCWKALCASRGNLLSSVVAMDVKGEGASHSSACAWDHRLYPCRPQHPLAWSQ